MGTSTLRFDLMPEVRRSVQFGVAPGVCWSLGKLIWNSVTPHFAVFGVFTETVACHKALTWELECKLGHVVVGQ